MKKIPALLLLLAVASISFAQITITKDDMPEAGNSILYSTDFSVGNIDYASTGADYTWDFSSLSPQQQATYDYKFGLYINPIYSAFFGFNSFGLKIADQINLNVIQFNNVYNFFKTSSSKFTAEGFGFELNGVPVPTDYQIADKVYQFPLQYGDKDTSNYRVSFQPDNNTTFTRKGIRINEADGYGTVITPYDTFNSLRVKVTLIETDSVGNTSLPFPVQVTRTSINYQWLSNTEKIPVVEVQGTDAPIVGYTPTQVRYRDADPNAVGIDEANRNIVSLYPNPSREQLWLGTPAGIYNVSITNLAGETLLYLPNYTEPKVDVSNLANGMYLLQIQQGNTYTYGRFTKAY
jgi:hypothetical protein